MIIYETTDFDEMMGAFTVLVKNKIYKRGDTPIRQLAKQFISYVLVVNCENTLDCEYRCERTETTVYTKGEVEDNLGFSADDIPF